MGNRLNCIIVATSYPIASNSTSITHADDVQQYKIDLLHTRELVES